jgi:hypothetical protein
MTPTEQKALEITEGFIMGALDAEGFDDINKCIQDAEALGTDAEHAYTDFKKEDAAGVIAGLKDLADGIKVIKAGMTDCSHLEADW